MKITVISPIRNESYMLPWYFRHYDAMGVDRYIIYDNESDDGETLRLCAEHPKVEVRTFKTGGKVDSAARRKIRNEAYKQEKSDWFIVCDCDEFIYHKNLRGYLEELQKKGITFPKVCGYQMVNEALPQIEVCNNQLYHYINRGIVDRKDFSKRAVFAPSVDIRYGAGAHKCEPKGNVVESPDEQLKMLHFKWINWDFAMGRMRDKASRRSDENIKRGWTVSTEEVTGEGELKKLEAYRGMLREARPVLDLY